jgi:hypothetical protein
MSQPSQLQPAQLLATQWLLSLVTVSLGGYLIVLSVGGQFVQLFLNMRLDLSVGVLLVLQLLFALAVAVLGFLFAPAPMTRRSIASAIVVAFVLVTVIVQASRLSGGFGPLRVFVGFTFADVFVMLTLALGAAWLVVRSRPGLAFISLALVVIVALVHWGLLVNNIDSATSQIVMLILSALVATAIGWGGAIASRLFGGNRTAATAPYAASPQHHTQQQAPAAYTQQNDRPAERGPVI